MQDHDALRPGGFISCDILIGGPGNPPHHFDVLIDAGGASTPTWQDVGPCQLGPTSGCDMSRFLLPIRPVGFAEPLPSAALPLNITGDAFKELLFYNGTTGSWNVQIGTTENSFTQGISGGWSPGWSLFRADFNGNGLDDLLLYAPSTGQWYKVINTGAGFTYYAGGWQPGFNVSILDLNGDSRSDVFLYNPATGIWFEGTEHGRRHPGV